MKTKLTPEESQRLIELGVDPDKASMCQIQHSADGETIYRIVEHDEFCYEMSCLRPKPIFDLSDILSLLPKEIEAPDYWGEVDTCSLGITTNNDVWEASYYGVDNVFRKAPELIDALYSLLVWAIENDYLNLKEK